MTTPAKFDLGLLNFRQQACPPCGDCRFALLASTNRSLFGLSTVGRTGCGEGLLFAATWKTNFNGDFYDVELNVPFGEFAGTYGDSVVLNTTHAPEPVDLTTVNSRYPPPILIHPASAPHAPSRPPASCENRNKVMNV